MAKSEWRVSTNYVGGLIVYQVFRLYDVQKTDHSGNREYLDGTFDTRDEADAVADRLNENEYKKAPGGRDQKPGTKEKQV